MCKRDAILVFLLALAVFCTGCSIETPEQHQRTALSSVSSGNPASDGDVLSSSQPEVSRTPPEEERSSQAESSSETPQNSSAASAAPAAGGKSPAEPAPASAPSSRESQPPAPSSSPAGSSAPVSSAPSKPPVLTGTLSIDCKTALSYPALDAQIKALLPADGMLMAPRAVSFEKGETVLDVLLREAAASQISVVTTGGYIRGMTVNGVVSLFEKDCGSLSGWNYLVNGEMPGVGAGSYRLKDGDFVQWRYTCSMGNDFT